MKINLKFFASLREVLQTSQETVELPADVITIMQLRDCLIARGEPWSSALAQGKSVRAALNHQMVEEDASLIEGAEVAFFPPVTGG
ncbi:molybdopterin converting factor subunit 1 [Polynucleobacter sp. 30F-ANTBAC]|jgi:sulfur-carrier protein|uniref:molybdopterin converting factor subunit 1 n=1 Tax=Polynucleobacter sp. 30F-ANTBAC TaxID=2689095 RepID=UPI001C0BB3D6|nr:molybdopterin converting factor subunit 1 [Polynucleobacter sp. 30F-ANTBAC]MBU3599281.1 molybdopterin converting factor subunit 1 [Polynucleobacter sp. 30F-ANTBAC]